MRLNGATADQYYGATMGGYTQSPPSTSSFSASGSASQSANGNVSILANPGLGVVGLVTIMFLILHNGGIRREG